MASSFFAVKLEILAHSPHTRKVLELRCTANGIVLRFIMSCGWHEVMIELVCIPFYFDLRELKHEEIHKASGSDVYGR